jgi:hypothetical protein
MAAKFHLAENAFALQLLFQRLLRGSLRIGHRHGEMHLLRPLPGGLPLSSPTFRNNEPLSVRSVSPHMYRNGYGLAQLRPVTQQRC